MDAALTHTIVKIPFPEVTASDVVLRRLWAWTIAAEERVGEVSALGEVDRLDKILHLPNQMHLLKQEGSFVHTSLDMDDLAILIDTMTRQGKNPERIRFWFHTHGSGGVFFSMTDDRTIEKLGEIMSPFVAAVFNTHGSSKWRMVCGDTTIDWAFKIPPPRPSKKELDEARQLVKEYVSKSSGWSGVAWDEPAWLKKWRKKHSYFGDYE